MEHLIPHEWFVGLHAGWLLLITVVSMAALMQGADLLVEGASSLAHRLGMSKIVVGATIVSLGTTSPECAVSVAAAWNGEPGLALGNAVGSIIADTGLIFGIGCLLVRLPADRYVLVRQGRVQVGVAVLLAALCYGSYALYADQARIDRWVGVLFMVLLGVYLCVSVQWSRRHSAGEPFQTPDDLPAHGERPERMTRTLMRMAGGLVLVIVFSHTLIMAVSELALQVGIPKVVIASTLVALGTSLPEMVIGLSSIRKGHPELLVGNVIGADILNVLFVTGAAALAAPLPIIDPAAARPALFLELHLPVMLAVLVLFRISIAKAQRDGLFHRWHGVPQLILYAAFIVLSFLGSR